MSLRNLALAIIATFPALFVACDEASSGCEEAKKVIEEQIKTEVCSDPAYAGTPFCICCVTHGYYSVSNDCTCRALDLNTDACYFAKGDQARPQTRDAVEYANSICTGRSVVVPNLEAGAPPCVMASATTSSSSSSSSGMQGGGGAGTTTSSSAGGTGGGP